MAVTENYTITDTIVVAVLYISEQIYFGRSFSSLILKNCGKIGCIKLCGIFVASNKYFYSSNLLKKQDLLGKLDLYH